MLAAKSRLLLKPAFAPPGGEGAEPAEKGMAAPKFQAAPVQSMGRASLLLQQNPHKMKLCPRSL